APSPPSGARSPRPEPRGRLLRSPTRSFLPPSLVDLLTRPGRRRTHADAHGGLHHLARRLLRRRGVAGLLGDGGTGVPRLARRAAPGRRDAHGGDHLPGDVADGRTGQGGRLTVP